MSNELQAVTQAIKDGNRGVAKNLLRDILKENPSAEAWYLASQLATGKQQKIKFLEKALELDPFYDDAANALDKLVEAHIDADPTHPPKIVRSENVAQAATEQLLQDTILEFTQRGWDVAFHVQNTTQLELRKGPTRKQAIIIAVILSIVIIISGICFLLPANAIILLLLVLIAKSHKITLQAEPNGKLKVQHSKGFDFVSKPAQVRPLIENLPAGISYAEAIIIGLAPLPFIFILLMLAPIASLYFFT